MKSASKIKILTDRYPFIGPTLWILSVQYFVVQIIVAMGWEDQYNYLHNTISDLGNNKCGNYAGRFVCSPLHNLMNLSFIILGVFMAIGSFFIYQEFIRRKYIFLGFSFLSIAGIGLIIVGIFPENSFNSLHSIGAFLPFFFGNLGIVILGLFLRAPRLLRIYSICTGALSLVAFAFFISHRYFGVGEGGMERLAAYPQAIWLIVLGIYTSKKHTLKHYIFSRKSSN